MPARWRKLVMKLVCCGILFTSGIFVTNLLPRDVIVDFLLDDHYFNLREKRVTPLDFDFTISGPSGCRTEEPLMVVLVLTVHDHAEERRAIRETWGSVVKTKQWGKDYIPGNVILIFMLSSPDDPSKTERVKKENEQFEDIVQSNFKDSYFNLTYKVLMGYKWVRTFCPSAKYVMKLDEDTFINMKELVRLIKNTYLDKRAFGPYYVTSLVHRSGKFRVEKENYPFLIYPPHLKGNFYIMPTALAFSVLHASEYMPYVSMEDVHITGILFKVVGGKHIGVSTSVYDPRHETAPDVCYFMQPHTLAAQNVSAVLAKEIWRTVLGEHKC